MAVRAALAEEEEPSTSYSIQARLTYARLTTPARAGAEYGEASGMPLDAHATRCSENCTKIWFGF